MKTPMKTMILRGGDGKLRGSSELFRAAAILREGGLCLIPTETVYGIACDAGNPRALARLRALKDRPPEKPFSVLMSELPRVYGPAVNDDIDKLARAFTPGPLTVILPRDGERAVGGGVSEGSVGVRVPAHEDTLELLRLCGFPLAAPSANAAMDEPPVSFDDALRRFDGKVECAIDGGDCARGVESTILDMTAEPPKIRRRGAISKRALENALGRKIDGMTVIGITGGSGAGKTTAMRVLKALGAETIDCDEVYNRLLTRDDMLSKLSERFPDAVSGGPGKRTLDKKALGEIVFRDEKALADLNAITHGCVGREVARLLREYERAGAAPGTKKLAAVDAIALIESGRAEACDLTVAISAPKEARVKRIMERDGISEEYARARVSAQKPEEFYRAGCDDTLINDGGDLEFERRCREYFIKKLQLKWR
jgi:tRNA threonylcarbamoyl adenosine modification protein (Sua5/YciO/YrdC/YwlC family)/dephospho-CoA kinase